MYTDNVSQIARELSICASHIREYSQTDCSYTKELLLKLLLLGCLVSIATRWQKVGGMQ